MQRDNRRVQAISWGKILFCQLLISFFAVALTRALMFVFMEN